MDKIIKDAKIISHELFLGVQWLNDDSSPEDVQNMTIKAAEVLALLKAVQYKQKDRVNVA